MNLNVDELEDRMLTLARKRGLLSDVHKDLAEPGGRLRRRWGDWIACLVAYGAVSEATLERLEDEVQGGSLSSGAASIHTSDSAEGLEGSRSSGSFGPYVVEGTIGRGGIGVVYRAWDSRLHRHVALKVLMRPERHLARRFSKEPKFLARVHHPNVCQVYETGFFGNDPYIAMQYIDGVPLDEFAGIAPIPIVVRVFRDISFALYAIHREQLIHRDIKPSNILVSASADHDPVPYLVDFGIARDSVLSSDTTAMDIVGTLSYMAPEQLRPGEGEIGPHTDVFGLGATLFEALCGRPPFPDRRLRQEEHLPSDGDVHGDIRLGNEIPRDLRTIVYKCIEEEPGRRYHSAKEVGEDLQRFLDQVPILARPPSLPYRFEKWSRRNRRVVLLCLVSCVIGIGLLAWLHTVRTVAAQQASAALRFGQEATAIETELWRERAAPLHDTAIQNDAIRARLEQIHRDLSDLPVRSRGPGHYALARGHLALGEFDEANAQFQMAKARGYRSTELDRAHALALTELHRLALSTAFETLPVHSRPQAIEESRRLHRDPALQLLRGAEALDDSPNYISAIHEYLEGSHVVALATARKAADEAPWLYEAHLLEGAILLEIAQDQFTAAERDRALESLSDAMEAYSQAATIAPSDNRGHIGMALVDHEVVQFGPSVEEYDVARIHALNVLQDAVLADSSSPEPWSLRCTILLKHGAFQSQYRPESQATLFHAANACLRAQSVAPGDDRSRRRLARVYAQMGEFHRLHGRDATPHFLAAIQLLEEGLAEQESVYDHWGLAKAYKRLAYVEWTSGQGGASSADLAIHHFQRALDFAPDDFHFRQGLAGAYKTRGLIEEHEGEDPAGYYDLSLENYSAATVLEPTRCFGHSGLANTLAEYALYEARRGINPEHKVQRALEEAEIAIGLRPSYYRALGSAQYALVGLALYQVENGSDPRPAIESMERLKARIHAISPEYRWANYNQACGYWVAARYQAYRGENPATVVSNGLSELYWLEGGAPSSNDLTIASQLILVLLRHQIDTSDDAVDKTIRAAESYVEEGLFIDPGNIELLVYSAEIQMMRGRWETAQGRAAGAAFSAAEFDLEEAEFLNPAFAPAAPVRAELHYWKAVSMDDQPAAQRREIQRGLDSCQTALDHNPTSAEVYRLQTMLHLLNSQIHSDPIVRRSSKESARLYLEEALSLNPNRSTELSPLLNDLR